MPFDATPIQKEEAPPTVEPKEHPVFSLEGLAAWLRTMPAGRRYPYMSCALGQYAASRGLEWPKVGLTLAAQTWGSVLRRKDRTHSAQCFAVPNPRSPARGLQTWGGADERPSGIPSRPRSFAVSATAVHAPPLVADLSARLLPAYLSAPHASDPSVRTALVHAHAPDRWA